MIILGIDPGSTRIGFGVIKKEQGKLIYLKSGLLNLPNTTKNKALPYIEKEINNIIKEFKPKLVGLEKIFSIKNKKTIIEVTQARGVIVNILIKMGLLIVEMGPQEVKLAVTGYGRASKQAVAKMVGLILSTPQINQIDDITDALAIAIAASSKIGVDTKNSPAILF